MIIFINKKEVELIFGDNLFERKELKNIFLSLISQVVPEFKLSGKDYKPFECIGTFQETCAAGRLLNKINYNIIYSIYSIV